MRSKYLTAASIALALTLCAGGINAAYATPIERGVSTVGVGGTSSLVLSDADLDQLVNALERLPESLKNADPRTTPNYEEDLAKALNSFRDGASSRSAYAVAAAQTNWLGCAAAVASFIASYGIPVAKVIGWIKKARALWGGVRGIWAAIRSGVAFAELGEDGVKMLEMILGVDGLAVCFQ